MSMTDDEINELRDAITSEMAGVTRGYADKRGELLFQALALIAAQQERIAELTGERDRFERNRDMWKGQCERQAERLRFAHDVIRPFALDL